MNHRSLLLVGSAATLTLTATLLWSADAPALPTHDAIAAGEQSPPTATLAKTTEAQRSSLNNGFYTAPVGTLLCYDADVRSNCVLGDGAQSQRIELDVSGSFDVVVAGRRADEIGLLVRMPHPNVRTNASAQIQSAADRQRVVSALQSGVLVRMARSGATVGLRMPPATSHDQQALWMSVLGALRFEARKNDAWRSTENDSSGRANVSYRWTEAEVTLEKQKTQYAKPADGSPVPSVQGKGHGTFDPNIGWLTSARYGEHLRLTVPGSKLTTTVEFAASFQLRDTRTVDAEFQWDGPWRTHCTTDGANRDILRDAIARQLEGVTTTELVARLAKALAEDPSGVNAIELTDLLIWMIRLNTAAVAELEQELLNPDLAPQIAGAMLNALGGAATPPAQALLSKTLGNQNLKIERRLLAAQSMFQLREPNDAARHAARTLATDTSAAKGLRGTGMLLLGAFARRQNGADGAANLLGLEASAKRDGLTTDWLGALGNARVPEAADAAARYMQSRDPGVRLAAVDALRDVRGSGADAALARGARDTAPMVRAQAARLLARRPSPAAFATVAQLVAKDHEAAVRGAALRGLRNRMAHPQVRQLVERTARVDPSAKLRALARKLLERQS